MKRLPILLFSIVLLAIPGCRKLYDQYIFNPKSVTNLCKITQIKFYTTGNEGGAIYNIAYDKKGNIISMLTDKPAPGIYFNFYFRYDSKNRLTDRLEVFVGSVGAMVWDSYLYYPNKIVDTSYFYEGLITDPHPPYSAPDKKWHEFKTDAHDRIIRNIGYYPLSFNDLSKYYTDTVYYKYNKNDNLIYEAPYTMPIYDDKINPYLTSTMWQLTSFDYSVNNATDNFSTGSKYPAITKYNTYGLPVKYVLPLSGYRFVRFGVECDSLEMTYDCDIPKINY